MKKVLIITYYWPPAGGPGVQRTLKFTKYMKENGWQPVILTVENPTSPAIDYGLEKEISKDCIIYKTKTFEPFGMYKKLTGKSKDALIPKDVNTSAKRNFKEKISKYIRANVFIPDARMGWIPSIIKEGKKIIEKENIDLIFSSSPPHSLQVGSYFLAKKTGVKWVADFRDPWTNAYWLKNLKKNKFSSWLDGRLERKVLKNADLVTTVSDEIIEMLYEKEKNNYTLIHNGFEKFIDIKSDPSEKFIVLFFGNLVKEENHDEIYDAIDSLDESIRDRIEFHIIGNVFAGFDEVIRKYKNLKFVLKDYMPKEALLKEAVNASVLIITYLKGIEYSKGTISAKFFDYLSLQKPILAVGEKEGVADLALKETNAGELFAYNDVDGIIEFIKKHFSTWEKEKVIFNKQNSGYNKYMTAGNVKKLCEKFDLTISGEK